MSTLNIQFFNFHCRRTILMIVACTSAMSCVSAAGPCPGNVFVFRCRLYLYPEFRHLARTREHFGQRRRQGHHQHHRLWQRNLHDDRQRRDRARLVHDTTIGSGGGVAIGSGMAGWWTACTTANQLSALFGEQTTGGIISYGDRTARTGLRVSISTSTSGQPEAGIDLVNNSRWDAKSDHDQLHGRIVAAANRRRRPSISVITSCHPRLRAREA